MTFPPRQDAIAMTEYETPSRKPGLAAVADPPELIARRAVQAAFFGFFVDMFEVYLGLHHGLCLVESSKLCLKKNWPKIKIRRFAAWEAVSKYH
jgi:hypothetical protein